MTTVSVGVPWIDPPAMSVRPSGNATADAPTRLSGVAPIDAHVPTACGGSACNSIPAADMNAATSTTPNAIRYCEYHVVTKLLLCVTPEQTHPFLQTR
jgi:hypothetical protein